MTVKVYIDWEDKEIYGNEEEVINKIKEKYTFVQFIHETFSSLELLRTTEEKAYNMYVNYILSDIIRFYDCVEIDIP